MLRVIPKNSLSLDQKKKSRQGPTDRECQPIFEYPPISDNLHPSLFTYQNQTLSEIRSRIRLRLDVNHFYELSVLVIRVQADVRRRPTPSILSAEHARFPATNLFLKELLNLKSTPFDGISV